MAVNFLIQRSIPEWGDSYVNWATESKGTAIVFIHGFGGSSLSTFGDFNLEFRYRQEFQGCDVFFYGYNSLTSQIANNAIYFLEFLRAINKNINLIIQNSRSSITRSNDAYLKIVIVAHSLGAVITRLALNEGFDSHEDWLHKCQLVLFAPAHIGAHKEFNQLVEFSGPLRILSKLFRTTILSFNQLVDSSVIIEPMTTKVKMLIEEKSITTFTVAKKVIWADPDRVVINRKFLVDPTAITFQFSRKGHQAICKPTKKFEQPLEILASIL